MNLIPNNFRDLMSDTSRAYAYLATLMPDGTPQVTPVWFNTEGEYILINSAKGRVKDRNMRRDPRVTILFPDPNSVYRYLQVWGEVVEITESNAREHINTLAKKYTDRDTFPPNSPDEVRVIYKIKLTKTQYSG